MEEPAREQQLPAEVLKTMIAQFVDYSRGRLPEGLLAELRRQGDWSRRYWATFSERTRDLIRDLLYGTIDDERFWAEIGL
jgi:hypothetical protein